MQTAKDLLELQQVDLAILRDRKAIEAIPQMAQIHEVRAKLKELARRTTKITGMLKDQRIEAEDNEGRRATLTRHVEEVKLDSATTDDFRHIQANNAQLDNLAKRLEKVDFNQQKVLAEIERLEGVMAQAAEIKARLDAREAELTEQFRETAADLKEDLRQLVARREALHERIPAELLSAYEESCAQHGQLGVAELQDGICTACRVEMQRSQIDLLRAGDDIATCPVCGRMLVVRTGA
jgi:hypothetical protein